VHTAANLRDARCIIRAFLSLDGALHALSSDAQKKEVNLVSPRPIAVA
jgi:hypothetical protein